MNQCPKCDRTERQNRTGKTDTYSVEADNAELRHYLTHLARRSSCAQQTVAFSMTLAEERHQFKRFSFDTPETDGRDMQPGHLE